MKVQKGNGQQEKGQTSDFCFLELHTRFDIVSRKEASDPVQDTFPPAVVILAQDVYYCIFLETQFIVFIGVVIVHGHH